MPGTFTVLSWNVETFGETKLGTAEQFIATTIATLDVDMVVFMENTKLGQAEVVRGIGEALQTISGKSWWGVGTDPTGKSLALPAIITYASFSRALDRDAYWRTLQKCYTNDAANNRYLLKPGGYTQNDVANCRESLELANILRRDAETYTGYFRYDPALHATSKVYVALGSWVSLWDKAPTTLVSKDAQGNEIGYADPTSVFTGRWPCVYQLRFANPSNPAAAASQLPFVSFHAPFGSDLDARVDANTGLLRLATAAMTGSLDVKNQPAALVAGDFNIDYDWTQPMGGLTNPIANTRPRSVRNYGAFVAEGFTIPIAENSSLRSVDSADPSWTNPQQFRSNAYDNIMVRGVGTAGPITAVTGSIIDLVDLTYKRFTPPGNPLSTVGGIPATPNLYTAFKYYRKQISDHLPAFCRLTVPPRP